MMAVFHVAGIVRVNLFLDVIHDRGDWQNLLARFGQSGFHSRLWDSFRGTDSSPFV
jgi:hypothetical protein